MSSAQPRTIGRYEIERLLGQGGMGRVWLARDTVLGRRVAIKVLRDDLALPPKVRDELIVRMGHEARAAASVSHPNIVTLHDMGEDLSFGLFLVFEYVTSSEGEEPMSLRDRLKRGALPLGDVARLAREVGSALSFAHEEGVIHRDVKPENILFSRTGFKIADFGIARIPESTITSANTVLGTPAYTAPEALSLGDFGPASDQFSLAATLYEAAAGARAFGGADPIATAGKVSSEPPPPLAPAIGSEPVVRALEKILERGLAKDPGARFTSCAELGQEVARAIESETSPRRPPGGRTGTLPTPVAGMNRIERTPLSSRAAMVERVESGAVAPPPDTSTLYARRRTQRFQNIAAGVAALVLIALVLMGRRTPHSIAEDIQDRADQGSASPTPAAAPKPTIRIAPRPSARPARDDAGPAEPRDD